MSKRPWVVFLAGVLLGAGGLGFLWFAQILKEALISWGEAQVYFDAEARQHIGDELMPSADGQDLYFYIDGFQDHRIFIAYTDTAGHLDQVVQRLTGKPISELEPWRDPFKPEIFPNADGSLQKVPNYHREPGSRDKKLLTSLYDVDVIRKGRFFEKNETSHGWHIIVDEETGRFYYHSWDT